jgi:Fe-S-cluster containining protein
VEPPDLTDVLCTRCGLCCDGSLFADVELAGRGEATRLEILGLEIEDDANRALLVQPCRALRGTRCSIYAHRPKCCRSFECRLLQDARRGAVRHERAAEQIAETRQQIERVKRLLTAWGPVDGSLPLREACAEALAADQGTGRDAETRRAELEAAMSEVDAMLQRTFLGAAES